MRALRRKVIENDVDAWSRSFLEALENAKKAAQRRRGDKSPSNGGTRA
jgi:trehalose 6-phosphate synthase